MRVRMQMADEERGATEMNHAIFSPPTIEEETKAKANKQHAAANARAHLAQSARRYGILR